MRGINIKENLFNVIQTYINPLNTIIIYNFLSIPSNLNFNSLNVIAVSLKLTLLFHSKQIPQIPSKSIPIPSTALEIGSIYLDNRAGHEPSELTSHEYFVQSVGVTEPMRKPSCLSESKDSKRPKRGGRSKRDLQPHTRTLYDYIGHATNDICTPCNYLTMMVVRQSMTTLGPSMHSDAARSPLSKLCLVQFQEN
jgi:hypothetical protein